MAASLVNKIGTFGASANPVITIGAGGVSAGNLLVIATMSNVNPPTAYTDTQGNTYAVDSLSNSNTGGVSIARSYITKPLLSGNTITPTGGGGNCASAAAVFTGISSSSPFDKQIGGGAASGTAWTFGNTTTTAQADELLICAFGEEAVGTVTTDAPMTQLDNFSSTVTVCWGWRVVSATGTYTAAATGPSVAHDGVLATYKAVGPVVPVYQNPMLMALGKETMLVSPKWTPVLVPGLEVTAVGGTTFPQAMDATAVLVTAAMQRQVNKGMTATAVAATGSMVRQVNKTLTATSVAVTAAMQKQVNKTLTVTAVVVTASLVALKVILKVMTATAVVVTATIRSQVNKAMTATSVAVTASRQLQVNKKLTATTVAVTATLQALKVILKAMTATTVAVTASMSRGVNKTMAATALATATVTKTITKTLTGTVSAIASLVTSFIPAGGAVGFLGMFRSNQAGGSGEIDSDADFDSTTGGASSGPSDEGGYTSSQGGRMSSGP